MNSQELNNYFDKQSMLPVLVFILGLFSIFQFSRGDYSLGLFTMLLSLIIYMGNNIFLKKIEGLSKFNKSLDDLSEFVAFGVSSIVFASSIYSDSEDILVLIIVFFFSIATILSIARNWTLTIKDSVGWPVPFNAIFIPLIYYSYAAYLQDPGSSIFLFYFIFVGMMSASNYNFLNNLEPKLRYDAENSLDNKILNSDLNSIEKTQNKAPTMVQQIEDFYVDDFDIEEENKKIDEDFEIDENEDFDLDETEDAKYLKENKIKNNLNKNDSKDIADKTGNALERFGTWLNTNVWSPVKRMFAGDKKDKAQKAEEMKEEKSEKYEDKK
jgi:phosphatidylserine synthase